MDLNTLSKIRALLTEADDLLYEKLQIIRDKFKEAPGYTQNKLANEHEVLTEFRYGVLDALKKAEETKQYYANQFIDEL